MTILSTHAASRVRNRCMGVLHLIAADESCEVSDILALLPFPSQPGRTSSHALAARTYPPAPVAVQAEGDAPRPSATHSAAPVVNPAKQMDPPAKHAAVGPLSSEPGGVQDPCESTPPTPSPEPQPTSTPAEQVHDEPSDIQDASSRSASPPGAEGTADPAPIVRKGKPARSKSKETREEFDARLITLHTAEPSLIRPRLAERLGVRKGVVNAAVARLELKVPHVRPKLDEPFAAEPVPPPNPQKPVGLPTAPGKTLTDRIRILHRQHPTWTAALIAKELGANAKSVSALLSLIRGADAAAKAAPEFAGRADMIQHYGDVAKRLGKPS